MCFGGRDGTIGGWPFICGSGGARLRSCANEVSTERKAACEG
ncbi:MAG TPA: hypothetical protein VFJ06_04705 [Halococcus sp.]|nr:hypothetical protein [Halococcus sp.]